MARRRVPVRGMGTPHRVPSCKHGKTQKEKDNARCRCPWYARYYDEHGQLQYGQWEDYDTAFDYLWDYYQRRKQRQGKISKSSLTKKGGVPTVAEIWPLYLASLREKADSTRKNRVSKWNRYIKGAFGDRKVTDVTWAEVDQWISTLSNLRPGSIVQTLAVLSGIFEYAIKDGWRDDNPTINHQIGDTHPDERYVPTPEEVHLIAHTIDPRYRLLIYLMWGAGLRLGEALAASSEIVHNSGILRIYRQWQDGKYTNLKHKKRGQFRDIPLSPILAAEIKRHVDKYKIKDGMPWFPRTSDPTKPVNANTVNAAIRKAVRDAGLADKKISAHNFRHAYATHGILSGISLEDMSKLLGHNDNRTTYQYYYRLVASSFDRVRDIVSTFMAMGAPEYAEVVDASAHRDEEIQRLKKRIAMLESVSR